VYQGVYLNLAQSIDRKELFENEIEKLNISHLYTRFESIIFKDSFDSPLTHSEIGCFKSHIGAIRESLLQNTHIHIAEDDIVFSKYFNTSLEYFLNNINKENLKNVSWDIFFTSFTVPIYQPYYERFAKLDRNVFNFFDTENFLSTGAFSYIINHKSKEKILKLLEENNFQKPIDLVYRELMNKNLITSYSIYPFITKHRYDNSTIQRKINELPTKFEKISQKPFFKDDSIIDIKKHIVEYANEIEFKITAMTTYESIFREILKMRDFINAKYGYLTKGID